MYTKTLKPGHRIFTCTSCKRKTRTSGEFEPQDVCHQCYELQGLVNQVYDGEYDPEFDDVQRDELVSELVGKGISLEWIQREFSDVFGESRLKNE